MRPDCESTMKFLRLAYQRKLEKQTNNAAKVFKTTVKMLRSVVNYLENVAMVDGPQLGES